MRMTLLDSCWIAALAFLMMGSPLRGEDVDPHPHPPAGNVTISRIAIMAGGLQAEDPEYLRQRPHLLELAAGDLLIRRQLDLVIQRFPHLREQAGSLRQALDSSPSAEGARAVREKIQSHEGIMLATLLTESRLLALTGSEPCPESITEMEARIFIIMVDGTLDSLKSQKVWTWRCGAGLECPRWSLDAFQMEDLMRRLKYKAPRDLEKQATWSHEEKSKIIRISDHNDDLVYQLHLPESWILSEPTDEIPNMMLDRRWNDPEGPQVSISLYLEAQPDHPLAPRPPGYADHRLESMRKDLGSEKQPSSSWQEIEIQDQPALMILSKRVENAYAASLCICLYPRGGDAVLNCSITLRGSDDAQQNARLMQKYLPLIYRIMGSFQKAPEDATPPKKTYW